MSEKCSHCRNGFLGNRFGQDVECVNGVLIDIDVFHEGWERDTLYPVAPCHPMWNRQQAGDEIFPNDCQERLQAMCISPEDEENSSETPSDGLGTTIKTASENEAQHIEALIKAAEGVITSASDTYKKRNGHLASFEDESGEKCWIVPFDAFESLRSAYETIAACHRSDDLTK